MKSQGLDMTGVGTSNTPRPTVTSDAGPDQREGASGGLKLTADELRAWLDRAPERPIDHRPWEEFELARAADPLAEAGHG
jgi:hypothetical protein